jgi:hypothetical protein
MCEGVREIHRNVILLRQESNPSKAMLENVGAKLDSVSSKLEALIKTLIYARATLHSMADSMNRLISSMEKRSPSKGEFKSSLTINRSGRRAVDKRKRIE